MASRNNHFERQVDILQKDKVLFCLWALVFQYKIVLGCIADVSDENSVSENFDFY